jgi:UDP-N-acetylglucosamine 2-epimerase
VKAAALIEDLKRIGVPRDQVLVVDTGQHYDSNLAGRVLRDLGLRPDVTLSHSVSKTPTAIFCRTVEHLEELIGTDGRYAVIVFGDADVALAGALAARRRNAPVLHIEAGARRDPTEQEHWTSRLVDAVADLRFAVTSRALDELRREGLAENSIVTGDMALDWFLKRFEPAISQARDAEAPAFVTLHRPNNMRSKTFNALRNALEGRGVKAVWLRHPRNQEVLRITVPSVDHIDPLAPSEVVNVMASSSMVITDSGGLAREAHWLSRPVVMRRDNGGWPELAERGYLTQLNTDEGPEVERAVEWATTWHPRGIQASPLINEDGRRQAVDYALPRFLGLG